MSYTCAQCNGKGQIPYMSVEWVELKTCYQCKGSGESNIPYARPMTKAEEHWECLPAYIICGIGVIVIPLGLLDLLGFFQH